LAQDSILVKDLLFARSKMAASASGIATLAALVLAGPAVFLILAIIRRRKNSASSDVVEAPAAEVQEREEVSGVDYMLGLLGYAIGIGNLWRFPYLVGKWGGGAFVLAYLTCLFMVAIPACLVEMVIGQYTRQSTMNCFKMLHPRWLGLGYCQAVMLFIVIGYYNVLLAYACIYIVGSLSDPLPWAADSASYWNNVVLNNYGGDYTDVGVGAIQWNLVVALLAVWVMVFFAIAFGKRILSKITWVTVVGPVVMLFVLLVRSVTLDGAMDGIEFYIGKFDADVLMNVDMWVAACGQILFSLSPGMGTAITMSSYTKPKEDVVKTCITVSICNSAFSLIGGIAIFSIIGNITYEINQAGGSTTVTEQAKAGTGLAFIAIADGMKTFGGGTNAMSVIFFMVLLTLGLDSTFAWVETFINYLEDGLKKAGVDCARWRVVAGACVGLFLCGLPYCTRMGNELLDTVDHYVCAYLLLLGVALEAVMVLVNFRWRRVVIAVKRATLGNRATPAGRDLVPERFWQFCLAFVVPVMTSFLFFHSLHRDAQEPYGGYPTWVQSIGWSLLLLCLVQIPIGAVINWKGEGTLRSIEEEEKLLVKALENLQDDKSPMASTVISEKSTTDTEKAEETAEV